MSTSASKSVAWGEIRGLGTAHLNAYSMDLMKNFSLFVVDL
jgi:hypothetical protein